MKELLKKMEEMEAAYGGQGRGGRGGGRRSMSIQISR